LSPSKQQTDTLLVTKNAERREKFTAHVANESAWRDYRGDHQFAMKRADSDREGKRKISCGPQFRTPQWERTVRRGE